MLWYFYIMSLGRGRCYHCLSFINMEPNINVTYLQWKWYCSTDQIVCWTRRKNDWQVIRILLTIWRSPPLCRIFFWLFQLFVSLWRPKWGHKQPWPMTYRLGKGFSQCSFTHQPSLGGEKRFLRLIFVQFLWTKLTWWTGNKYPWFSTLVLLWYRHTE